MYGTLILVFLVFALGCGGESGGTGGTASTTTGGAGGAACVEPVPPNWTGALQPYSGAVAEKDLFSVLPDEAGGKAGVANQITFVCAHDFVGVGVGYREGTLFGLDFFLPSEVRVDLLFGDAVTGPFNPPEFSTAACFTDGSAPACESVTEGEYTLTKASMMATHVEPGDTIYITAQLDTEIGVAAGADPMIPSPGWYYAPPGSAAGGPTGLWAALDNPPPGVQSYPYSPAIRLYE